MRDKSVEELKEYQNKILSIEEFETLKETEAIKLIQFEGSELGIKKYPVSKYSILLEDKDVVTIYEDIPTW